MTLDTIVKRNVTAAEKIRCSTLTKPTVVLRGLNAIEIRYLALIHLQKSIGIRLRASWGLESCKVPDTIGVSGLYFGVVSTPDTARLSRQFRHWSW